MVFTSFIIIVAKYTQIPLDVQLKNENIIW